MKPPKTEVTDRQRRFAEEYLIDLKPKQAAIRAGYSPKSAAVQAANMLKKPHVAELISRLQQERSNRTAITADRVLEELAYLAFSRVDHYDTGTAASPIVVTDGIPDDAMRAVASVKKTILTSGEDENEKALSLQKIEIKLWDKPRALSLAMRHLGMLNDKLQLDVGIELKKVIFEKADEYDRQIARLAERKGD